MNCEKANDSRKVQENECKQPQRPKFQKEKILLFQNSRNMGFNRQIYDLFQKDAFSSASVVFHCFARLKSIRLKKMFSRVARQTVGKFTPIRRGFGGHGSDAAAEVGRWTKISYGKVSSMRNAFFF
jgi:hypothetical protein